MMDADSTIRGRALSDGGLGLQSGTGVLARLIGGSFHKIVDRVDAGLAHGAIAATLPDRSRRLVGGRGPGPRAEIDLRDWRALVRLATGGSVGWYQAWEAGEWTSPDPVAIFDLFMRNASTLGDVGRAKGPWRWISRLLHARRANSKAGARENIGAHYDLGNDFYAQWLDPTMSYSSALWRGLAADAALADAQENKINALAERLMLKPGNRVLEIGCGWGHLAKRLVERHGATVTGISLSNEQLAWARQAAAAAPLTGLEYRYQDYRDVSGSYDAVASVEMVEAVGRDYWPVWFDCIARALRPGGRAAIQFIWIRDDLFESYARSADFIQTYIFPGGMLVKASEFEALATERGMSWEDRVDFGDDYAKTLQLWRHQFDAVAAAGRLPEGFDARFIQLWRYYLMYCEGGFRSGGIGVSQVTMVKAGP